MTTFKNSFIAALFLLFSGQVFATHIVGGGITYECIGTSGNSKVYRFTMKVYRDCLNGTAQFDSPANIAIYRGDFNSNSFYSSFGTPLQDVVPIGVNEPDCIDNLPSFCLEEGTYTWEATLPISNQSYFIEYQRCCRTNAITNILLPGDTGATYYVEITPEAQQLCNSSPIFNHFPPVVICNNYPLEVDYSATDPDGDQLVYSFCAPFSGGSSSGSGCFAPQPPTPCPPPYDEVSFIAPNYFPDQPMGGSPIVTINPQTGVISGTPHMNGQFVVGVCVEEYRNGQLLSTTRRDFQFNVTDCAPQVTALVGYDEITGPQHYVIKKCTGTTTVTIDNQSTALANIHDFEWNFDLHNGNTLHNTTDFDLTVNFPGLGVYDGTLILNKGLDCGDTAYIRVELYAPASLNLGPDVMICNGGNVTLDGGTGFESYHWQNGATTQTITATTSGAYILAATDHCGNVLRDTVQVSISQVPDINLADISLCPGKSVTITVPGFTQYAWSPASGLSCTDCSTVTVQPTASTSYTLSAVNQAGCSAQGTLDVTVLPTPMRTYVIQFYPNQTVTIAGQTFTQPGTVMLTVPSTTGGCDSLNTYILELLPTTLDIQCPPNVTVAIPNNTTSTAVNYPQPTAASDCPGAPPSIQLTQGLASGSNFPAGVNTVCYEASNTCGNTASCCFTVTATTIDIQCPPNVTVALPNNTGTTTVNYPQPTVTSDCPGTQPTVQLTQGLASGSGFPAGVNNVCYEASNTCGNSESCCFTVTVTTLNIQCPANVTVALPNNTTTTAVNYPQPTATTDCPGSQPTVQLTQGLASGASFPAGVNTVCYSATNTCGNSASCCFTVTVTTIDIQCPANMTVAIPNNANSTVVNYPNPTASTNCPGAQASVALVQGPASGGSFPAGVTTVCYNATNTCGNSKSCCFTVTGTTLDIHCPANVSVQLPVAGTTVAVNYAAPTTTTNCPNPAVTVTLLQGLASGGGFPLGVNKVCYDGSNTCGNHDTCCFTVTVTDAPPPCDIKVIGCMKFELLDIRLDSINQRRFRIRATNFCASELDYVAIELPPGVVGVTPLEGSIYTAPNTGNQYRVRNPNASPFYSTRYRSMGIGLTNGQSDVFEQRLPQQSHTNMNIHIMGKLKNGEAFEAYLNTWYCPVQPWAGSKDGADLGTRDDENAIQADETVNTTLAIHPNPTDGMLYVDMNPWQGQSVQVQVLNAQGQRVVDRHYDVENDWLELDLDRILANGLYFLTVQPVGGPKATTRFVFER